MESCAITSLLIPAEIMRKLPISAEKLIYFYSIIFYK